MVITEAVVSSSREEDGNRYLVEKIIVSVGNGVDAIHAVVEGVVF